LLEGLDEFGVVHEDLASIIAVRGTGEERDDNIRWRFNRILILGLFGRLGVL